MTRNKKAGYIYLLEGDDNETFKYGCTKRDPKYRIYNINSVNEFGCKFKLISKFKSTDIFKTENNIKWGLLSDTNMDGIPAVTEYIPNPYKTVDMLINKFLSFKE